MLHIEQELGRDMFQQLQVSYNRYLVEKDVNEVREGGEEIACGVVTADDDCAVTASNAVTDVEVDEHELLIYWQDSVLHKDQYEEIVKVTYIHKAT